MNRIVQASAVTLLGLVGAFAGTRTAFAETTISFDFDQYGNPVVQGQIVDNEYDGRFLKINADNYSATRDLAVAFNSNATGTASRDLQAPWTGGNFASSSKTSLGNLLVIQDSPPQRYDADKDGILDSGIRPKDETSSPAGHLAFDFRGWKPLGTFGLTVVDIPKSDASGYTATFYRKSKKVGGEVPFNAFTSKQVLGGVFYDSTVQFGSKTANILQPITLEKLQKAFDPYGKNPGAYTAFDRVVIRFKGGGGVGAIKYRHVTPEPGSLALLGMGAAGFWAMRRRHAGRRSGSTDSETV